MSGVTLLVLCVLGCIGVALSPLPSSEMVNPDSSRAKWIRRAEIRMAATVLLFSVFAFGLLYCISHGVWWPAWPLAAWLALGIALVQPWLPVRWLFIPLGWVRVTVGLSRLGGQPWVRDPEGGAVLAGVMALMRGSYDPTASDWLAGQLRRGPLRGAGLVASGLLAAQQGDRDMARALLASIDELDPDLCPPMARQVALDWLVADAAQQGQWSRVIHLAEGHLDASRTVRLLVDVAAYRTGQFVRGGQLWRRWLLAPRRRHTFGLVWRTLHSALDDDAQALGLGPVERPELAPDFGRLAANHGIDPEQQALALHAEAITIDATEEAICAPPARFERLGAAWDQLMESFPFRGQMRRRAEALRCSTVGELVVARLARDVCQDIAQLMARGQTPTHTLATQPGGTLARAVELLQDRLIEELDVVCRAMGSTRPPQATVTQVVDQWLTWLDVQRRYEDLARVGGPELRREAYPVLESQLRLVVAWLWNDLRERGLANAISTWLLLEAERVHDEESAAYHRHNVALVI